MEPATRNFVCVEGDTFQATLTLRDKDSGLAVDLTGATCKMQVRTSYNAVDPPALEFVSGSGLTVVPLTGVISLSKTVAMLAGDYVYDFQVVFPGSITRTFLRGRFKVLEGVTV